MTVAITPDTTNNALTNTGISMPAAQGEEDVEAGLLAIMRKYLKSPDAAWTAQTTMEEAQVDSLDLVEIVFEIEERFGVEINFNANSRPVSEMNFGDVVQMIHASLASKARAA
ncbi:acyl carrier protein [Methylorubrum suomiense]|uniref:Acyl carrier protein n=1 Tax=Methylorubrum suomiense TaxID=144191 RepID=A0ABQ4V1I4_9HYPH|nr:MULTISPECIES: acyl carrier protein [Methylobacteriaceae]GJE78208.1 Acyl carrier protein [Methylorubrum suomiense]